MDHPAELLIDTILIWKMGVDGKETRTLFIVGPTGVGKTDLAIEISEKLCGEIVSADSRQIYKWMDIGTDKVPVLLQERIPHYIVDIVTPEEYFSAGKFSRLAQHYIKEIIDSGRQPIVVGGAGLYLRAVLDGIFPEDAKDLKVKSRLRREAEEHGTAHLYKRLQEADPTMAASIRPGDTQRIIRALEVFEVTGKSLSEHWQRGSCAFDLPFVMVGLQRERKDLYERIENRVDEMLRRGLVEEVQRLRSMGYGRDLNSQLSVGYREVHAYLDGDITYERMAALIKQHTRNYAKRQLTWFKKDKRIRWFLLEPGENSVKIMEDVLHLLEQ